MRIKAKKVEAHWNYLLSIEGDLEVVSRFIELDKDNFQCFSIEISRLLMAAAAEVDVVCKQICKKLDPKSKADKINIYQKEIVETYSSLPDFEVIMPRYGLTMLPWKNWGVKNNNPPLWWSAYNKIKHYRHTHYQLGNLENAIHAVAGLFVVVLHLYSEKARSGELLPAPKLLQVSAKHYGGASMGNYGLGICYKLL